MNLEDTFMVHGKQRIIKARPKFSRASVPGSLTVHAVTAVYLRWWAGSWPDSLEMTVAFACSGRQPTNCIPLSSTRKITCARCKKNAQ